MRLSKFLYKNGFYKNNKEVNISIGAVMPLLFKTGEIRDAVVQFVTQYKKGYETLEALKNEGEESKKISEEEYERLKEAYEFLNRKFDDIVGIKVGYSNRIKLEDFLYRNGLTGSSTTNVSAMEIAALINELGPLCDSISEFVGQFESRKSDFDANETMANRYTETNKLLYTLGDVEVDKYFDEDMQPVISSYV